MEYAEQQETNLSVEVFSYLKQYAAFCLK